jgi:sec-independent protein translocase protein TatA
MGALSPLHLVIVLVVALLVLGPGKLPETGAALGRAIREFRNAVDGTADAMATATAGVPVDASTPPPAPATAAPDRGPDAPV